MSRLYYIDEIRGFAILLVCMGHIFGPHSTLGNLQPTTSVIGSFSMALFFFISGYLIQKTHGIEKKGVVSFIKKKSYRLFVPYLFWLYIAPYFLYNRLPSSIFEVFEMLNFYPNKNVWFLPCLFYMMLIWGFSYVFIESKLKFAGLKLVLSYSVVPMIFVVFGIVFHLFFFLIYAVYMGAFLFGYFLSKYERLRNFVLKNGVWGGATLVACVVWKLYFPIGDGGGVRTLIMIVLYTISSFASCIVFYNIFKKVELPKCVKCSLCEWGKMSLIIYLFPIALVPSTFVFPDNWTLTMVNLFVLGVSICQCFISSAIGEMVLKIPVLSFIMFGKK